MSLSRRSRESQDIWPGFVDALATLLMVIIFLLMLFVVSQFYLSDALLGRDKALDRLNSQVAELSELLDLERSTNADLRSNISQISSELQSSLRRRDALAGEVEDLRFIRDRLQAQLKQNEDDLAAARDTLATRDEQQQTIIDLRDRVEDKERTISSQSETIERQGERLVALNEEIEADKEKIKLQVQQLAEMQYALDALEAYRAELEEKLANMEQRLASTQETVEGKDERAARLQKEAIQARAEVALLNRQMQALRDQIAALNDALEASEKKDAEQKTQIANLGQRLNAALASRVQELARYRSEFFGRLREVLGDRKDIQIVGDRFVFQSEVFFESGSAQLGQAGKEQLARLADTLNEIADKIPEGLNWILRVDGHTDSIPINTARFPSNWELSSARAISVVQFLIDQGIPPNRLAAAGFGQYQPLVEGNTQEDRRRNRRIEIKLDSAAARP